MDINKKDLIIFKDGEIEISVDFDKENETVWLNREQIAELFDRDIKTIGKHINNIFNDGSWKKVTQSQKLRLS